MVRRISASLAMPGGDRDDLAQHARLGLLDAVAAWDPARRVPFKSFALCARREAVRGAQRGARRLAQAARTARRTSHASVRRDGCRSRRRSRATYSGPTRTQRQGAGAASGWPGIRGRVASLTEPSTGALALSANDDADTATAPSLPGVGERAVDNALQRARRKLLDGGRPGPPVTPAARAGLEPAGGRQGAPRSLYAAGTPWPQSRSNTSRSPAAAAGDARRRRHRGGRGPRGRAAPREPGRSRRSRRRRDARARPERRARLGLRARAGARRRAARRRAEGAAALRRRSAPAPRCGASSAPTSLPRTSRARRRGRPAGRLLPPGVQLIQGRAGR